MDASGITNRPKRTLVLLSLWTIFKFNANIMCKEDPLDLDLRLPLLVYQYWRSFRVALEIKTNQNLKKRKGEVGHDNAPPHTLAIEAYHFLALFAHLSRDHIIQPPY